MADARAPKPELIEEARRVPGGWVYEIQGSYGSDESVPPESIVGAWKVDETGNLTGEYRPNPRYRKP